MRKGIVPFTAGGLTAILVLAGAILATLGPSQRSIAYAIGGSIALVWAALGVAVSRRPSGWVVGLLMTLVAVNIAFTTTKETGWAILATHPDLQGSLAWPVAVLSESAWWLVVTLSLLLLYFPEGRLPSPRWRLIPPALVAAAVVYQAWGAMDPTPFRAPLEGLGRPFPPPPPILDAAGIVAFCVLLLGIVICAASPLLRFRHADGKPRAQIKWIALAGIGVPAFLFVGLVEVYILGGPSWPSVAVALGMVVGLPTAVAIAMIRHDLYDVDRALAAAATYTLATGALLLVFGVTSAVIGVVLGRDSTIGAAVATAVSALALVPLLRAARQRVDHHLYPLREAALAAVRSLEQRTHSGEARPEQLENELQSALRDPGLRVAYHLPGGSGFVDMAGAFADTSRSVPITMDGSAIGALIPSSDSLSESLLREVGRAAGTLVEIVRLRVELTAVVHELEASRSRLVHVGDEERRRLERDLHDGAQQRLVSLGMSLRLAQRHIGERDLDIDAVIDAAVAELGTAVAELRQIAHGLRPSSLDDGLPRAISALSRGFPVPIHVDVTPIEIPDALATTIYFVASEALANAVKYAGASRIGVRVAPCEQGVEVSVQDDGNGNAVIQHGSGLAGLRDRVAAVGGTFSVEAAAGRGTVVRAIFLCAL